MAGRQQGTGPAIPPGDLRLVAAAFGLGSVHQARFLPEGLISRNWQITAGRGVFALKQIRDAPLPQARRNLRLVAALHAAGIPAFEPALTVTGDTVAEAGSHGYCLSWWIKGRHLHGTQLTSGQARHAGAVLGRVHEGLNQAGPRAGLPDIAGSATTAVPDAGLAAATADQFLARIARLHEPEPWDLTAAESLRQRKELLRKHAASRPRSTPLRGPSGWTHGDFHPLNLIWNRGEVTGVVDWNRLAVRTFGEEVTRSATLLFSRDDGQIDLGRVAEFAAGYRQVIPLDPDDLADAVHRRWWKLLCDYRYLDLHYTRDDHACDHLAGPAARLLQWWTSHQQELMTAFTTRPEHRSPVTHAPGTRCLPQPCDPGPAGILTLVNTTATALRPAWDQLPARLRDEMDARLGGISSAAVQPGGFTPGMAARLRLADGTRVFAKGIPASHVLAGKYRAEAITCRQLPAATPAPRLRWDDQIAGWVVLVFDDIDGRHPDLSPGSPDTGHVVAMTAALGPVLTPCPVASAPAASAGLAGLVHGWTELAAAPPHDLDPWTRRHLTRLAALETGWLAAADGDTLLHGDINASNLLITPDGKTWLVDWAQPVRGAAWIDVADLIPHLILGGHTPAQAEHALAAVPAWTATPPETITSYAAAFAGYWARSSRLPDPPGVPSLRAYQARAAQAAIAWTAYRTGWPRSCEHAPPDK